MPHPHDRNLPSLLGPSFAGDPADRPGEALAKCQKIASGFDKVAQLYQRVTDLPPAGAEEELTDAERNRRQALGVIQVFYESTIQQRRERAVKYWRLLNEAFELELSVRAALVKPAGEVTRLLRGVADERSRTLNGVRQQYAEKIALRDFPGEVPVSPEVCGPVRREKERFQSISGHVESARRWSIGNREAIERLHVLKGDAKKRLTTAEKELKKLSA